MKEFHFVPSSATGLGDRVKSRIPENINELLLDYHMGQLDPPDRDQVEKVLETCPDTRAKSHCLSNTLASLDAWQPPEAPANLVDSVLTHIDRSQTFKFDSSSIRLPSSADSMLPPSLMSLREILAVAASILIIVGVFVPGYYGVKQKGQRTMCSSQLGAVGAGLSGYVSDYDDQLPFAGGRPGASWLPASADVFSNTRHPYLLVKMRYTRPAQMMCPGCTDEIDLPLDGWDKLDDFPSPNQMSYSWQVPLGPMRQANLNPGFAISADHTPLIQDGQLQVLSDPNANSTAHGAGAGQNVLYIDGHVKWRKTPNSGVSNDNIYQAGKATRYSGREKPLDANDSFLVSPH